ncbi:LysR substrate-binding domain-containing protein, partial [Salmonella enterica subsp. enterica serovar Kentucky]|nr:LysR substrate-binding domain-containing protein [Salmonella enterica subsp. enterica serovar Kentucky]
RAEHPSVEIKLTTGDAADAMDKVVTGEADLAIAGKPETLPGAKTVEDRRQMTVCRGHRAENMQFAGKGRPLLIEGMAQLLIL